MLIFEWDERKERQNRKKHGISFEAAAQVFLDPFAVTDVDQQFETEERLKTIGRARDLILIVVIHLLETEESDLIVRIISARRADPHERSIYEETHA